jgi:hypothetical protein
MAELTLAALALPASLLYLTPALVACARRLPGTLRILLLNLLAGWTVAGWAACLVMALRPADARSLHRRPGGGAPGGRTGPAPEKRASLAR